jgi:hypothetical protein
MQRIQVCSIGRIKGDDQSSKQFLCLYQLEALSKRFDEEVDNAKDPLNSKTAELNKKKEETSGIS